MSEPHLAVAGWVSAEWLGSCKVAELGSFGAHFTSPSAPRGRVWGKSGIPRILTMSGGGGSFFPPSLKQTDHILLPELPGDTKRDEISSRQGILDLKTFT